MKRLALVLWLTVLWVALWDDASAANLLTGALIGVVLTAVFPMERARPVHRVRALPMLRFAAFFTWKLLEANVQLAREILTIRDTTRTGIVAVPRQVGSDLVTTVVANAISLTPGTLTLAIREDPPIFYVHVLHLNDRDAVVADIQRLEGLARRAFGFDAEHPVEGAGPVPGIRRPS